MADSDVCLYYFDGRGLAEPIRMMLCVAGIKFDSVNFESREQFLQMKSDGELLFHCVPMLKIDGLRLVQKNAILWYLARRARMDGNTPTEKAEVDMFYEGTRDLHLPMVSILFHGPEEDTHVTMEKLMPKYLPIFDKRLGDNGTGFLVGSAMTLADVGLLEAVLMIKDYYPENLEAHTNIQRFVAKMEEHDGIIHYIKHVRKPKNTVDYVQHAKQVLNMP